LASYAQGVASTIQAALLFHMTFLSIYAPKKLLHGASLFFPFKLFYSKNPIIYFALQTKQKVANNEHQLLPACKIHLTSHRELKIGMKLGFKM
jgi:hypothetical protein